jgi:hypothetical protein
MDMPSDITRDDVATARALERCEPPNDGFNHLLHLRVAWVYLTESASVDEAIHRIGTTLRRFAASIGKAEKYSQPTTEFWVHQVAAVRALMPGADVDTALGAYPRLLDKNLILAYYSSHAAAPGAADPSSHPSDRVVPRPSP